MKKGTRMADIVIVVKERRPGCGKRIFSAKRDGEA